MMPVLTGSLSDVTGVELASTQVRQAFVKAPAARGSLASGNRLLVSSPVAVDTSGTVTLELEPGPAVLVIDTYAGGPDVYDLHVTEDMTLLSEALAESAPAHQRSWAESVMVQLRGDTVDAAGDAETAKEITEAHREHVDSIRDQLDEAAQGNVAPYLTQTALNANYAPTRVGQLPVATDVVLTAEGTYQPIECEDGVFWGCSISGQLATSTDGATWTPIGASAPTRLTGFIKNGAGELVGIAGMKAYKTTGWATNPATATWAEVTQTSPGTATFNRHTFSGSGDKFILTEYSSVNRADSRWGQISVDGGSTWTTVWDTDALFPATAADSHLHTACYDPWSDRFYLAEGHGVQNGIYSSDDNGSTWTKMTGGLAGTIDPTPTVMTATDDGIVCGSDAPTWAVMGIPRNPDGSPGETMIGLYRWDDYREGVLGFGLRGWRDPSTGAVHVPFMSANSDGSPGKPIVVAGTAVRAALVWQSPDGGSESRVRQSLVLGSRIVFVTTTAGVAESKQGIGNVVTATPVLNREDDGNTRGGHTAGRASSVASGPGATTGGFIRSVAFGPRSSAGSGTGGEAVSVGYAAVANDFGTAVGSNSKSTGTGGSVSIGRNSEASGQQATSSGFTAKATGAQSIAFGANAEATSSHNIAIGSGAKSTGSVASMAFGSGSSAANAYSVAMGRNVATTRDYQFAVGPVHMEMKTVGLAVTNSPAGAARVYVADNGSGKMQLMVRFPTGGAVALATEA